MTRLVETLAGFAEGYEALYCDVWGVLHDGLAAFPEAVAALRGFRAGGGRVLLLTNAPRPFPEVAAQLDALGVPRDAWDAIATSGDAAQSGLAAGDVGFRVHHVGPEKDLGFFTRMAPDIRPARPIERVTLREAEGIVCTGLVDDETETPEDYRPLILEGTSRGLKMLCANPDILVHRGGRRVWCAGAIARAYAEAGGEVLYYGKPHAPIYMLAGRRLDALGGAPVSRDRILCVGDGLSTDIAGGIGEGFDTLFVTGGIAAGELGPDPRNPDPVLLERLLAAHELSPLAAIPALR